MELHIQAYISGHSQGMCATPGQLDEGKANQGKQCHLSADAGSIEKYGIELTLILVAGIAEVTGAYCYDLS